MNEKGAQEDPAKLAKMLKTWAYRFSNHAFERLQGRKITVSEVRHVLRNGLPEPGKHSFDKTYASWNYAVRGKTVDDRDLRLIVAVEGDLLIVTVMDLKR